MVVPYDHHSLLDQATKESIAEMMDLVTRAQTAISEAYSPDGINIGARTKASGAGADSHSSVRISCRDG